MTTHFGEARFRVGLLKPKKSRPQQLHLTRLLQVEMKNLTSTSLIAMMTLTTLHLVKVEYSHLCLM